MIGLFTHALVLGSVERKNIDQQNSVTQCEENMLLTKLFST